MPPFYYIYQIMFAFISGLAKHKYIAMISIHSFTFFYNIKQVLKNKIKGYPFILLFIDTACRIFHPYNIFKYLISLLSFGLLSDYFIALPPSTQMSILLILTGIVIEIYDNHNLKIKYLIKDVSKNKLNYAIFIFSRCFWLYIFVSFLIFTLLLINIEIINTYILGYIYISWIKKLLFFSWLGDIFFDGWGKPHLCDCEEEWDKFVARKVVIMPPKYKTITVLDPDLNRAASDLWYYRNSYWRRYYWNSYHAFDMQVYVRPDFRSESILINAWPLPNCDGLYRGVQERSGSMSYRPLDIYNRDVRYNLYFKDIEGNFVSTPFRLQNGIKVIK